MAVREPFQPESDSYVDTIVRFSTGCTAKRPTGGSESPINGKA